MRAILVLLLLALLAASISAQRVFDMLDDRNDVMLESPGYDFRRKFMMNPSGQETWKRVPQ